MFTLYDCSWLVGTLIAHILMATYFYYKIKKMVGK